jgi:hypothetical protein
MLARSFHSVSARLVPAALLLPTLILAGCGGSGASQPTYQDVRAAGFRFQAPVGWSVKTAGRMTTAARDSELVQVATFPLAKPYTPALFDKVASEIAVRMAQVAHQSGGAVSGSSVARPGGIKSHVYDVKVGDHVDQYVFVLRGKREYQLLCRRKSSSSEDFCEQLIASFALT